MMIVRIAEKDESIACRLCERSFPAVVIIPGDGENEEPMKVEEGYELCVVCIHRLNVLASQLPADWGIPRKV